MPSARKTRFQDIPLKGKFTDKTGQMHRKASPRSAFRVLDSGHLATHKSLPFLETDIVTPFLDGNDSTGYNVLSTVAPKRTS